MKRTGIAILLAVIVLAGCANSNSANDANVRTINVQGVKTVNIELNDRQKQILDKEGLPQDYQQLDNTSKDVIAKVEQCFDYMDEKYPDIEFEYVTFILRGISGGRERTVVYDKADKRKRPVSIFMDYSDGEYQFTDTYMMSVVDSDNYADEVKAYILSKYPDTELFVYDELDPSDYIEGDTYIMQRASGTTTIVMANAFANEDEAQELLDDVLKWMITNKDGAGERVYLDVYSLEDFRKTSIETYGREFRRETDIIYELEVKAFASSN